MSKLPFGGEDMSFKISWKMHLISLLMTILICYIMKNSLVEIATGVIINDRILDITGNILIDVLIFTH